MGDLEWRSSSLRQALGDKAMRFDARKLGWVGAPTKGYALRVALWPTPD